MAADNASWYCVQEKKTSLGRPQSNEEKEEVEFVYVLRQKALLAQRSLFGLESFHLSRAQYKIAHMHTHIHTPELSFN